MYPMIWVMAMLFFSIFSYFYQSMEASTYPTIEMMRDQVRKPTVVRSGELGKNQGDEVT